MRSLLLLLFLCGALGANLYRQTVRTQRQQRKSLFALLPNGTISIGQPKNITLNQQQFSWLTVDLSGVGPNQALLVNVTAITDQEVVSLGWKWPWVSEAGNNDQNKYHELTDFNFGDAYGYLSSLIVPACGFVSASPNNQVGNFWIEWDNFVSSNTQIWAQVTITTFSQTCQSVPYVEGQNYTVKGKDWLYIDLNVSATNGAFLTWNVTNAAIASQSYIFKSYSSYTQSPGEYPDAGYITGGSLNPIQILKPEVSLRVGIMNTDVADQILTLGYSLNPFQCTFQACGPNNNSANCLNVTTCVGAKNYKSVPLDPFGAGLGDGFLGFILAAISTSPAACRSAFVDNVCIGMFLPCDANNFLAPVCPQTICDGMSGCTLAIMNPQDGQVQAVTFPTFANYQQCEDAIRNDEGLDFHGQPPPSNNTKQYVGKDIMINYDSAQGCFTPPAAAVPQGPPFPSSLLSSGTSGSSSSSAVDGDDDDGDNNNSASYQGVSYVLITLCFLLSLFF